ncbi:MULTISPECIES: hypothetical protein [unclassified Nitratiruptor]|uniref:hypothetical protein n=1 Tax=unclassified Nitratiruptor TaxID=2624044 RepID=UPI001915FBDA|nr:MULTISPECIES: hypothetical protein [unclassified Nitratiruptor]
MKRLFFLLLIFVLTGCGSRELSRVYVADEVVNYFMPYSSIDILVPQSVEVVKIEKVDEKRAIAKVCYQFRFLTSYESLVNYIKKHPNSHFAKFDFGLVALLGKKFDNFQKNDIKKRCDDVVFEKRYGKWVLTKI